MLPERIILKNFLNFENVNIDLSKRRKVLVLGVRERDSSSSNGSGKSNLLRSIPWCIWGKNPEAKKISDSVKWGTDFCSVTIELKHGGKPVIITRTSSLKTNTSTLDFYIDGVLSNGNSIDETNAKIVSHLNLDYNAYINSVYINQNDLFSLANSRDKDESRELLERVLGLNEYDEFEETTEKEIDELSTKRDVLSVSLESLQSQYDEIESNRTIIESEKIKLERNEASKIEIKSLISTLSSEYDGLRDAISKNNLSIGKISSSENILSSMNTELTSLIARANVFKRNMEDKKIRCNTVIQGEDLIIKSKTDFDIKIRVNNENLEKIESVNRFILRASSNKDATQQKLSDIEKRIGVIQHDGKSIKKNIDNSEGKKNNPSIAIGSKCDYCLTDISQDTLDHYVGHLTVSIKEDTDKLDILKKEALALSTEKTNLITSINEINENISSLRQEKDNFLRQILSEKTIKYEQETIAQKFEDIRLAKIELDNIDDNKEIEKWKETVGKKKDDIINFKQEIDSLKKSSSISDGFQQVISNASTLKIRIENLNSEIGKIEGLIYIVNSNVDLLTLKQNKFDTIKDEIAKIQEDISGIDSLVLMYGELIKAFGPMGIRHHILGTAIDDLQKEANDILPKISSGNMSIEFKRKKEVKKSNTEKLAFEVLINDGQKVLPFNMYSGGEQLRISFVIRVALSKLLLKRANSELELLILDEALSSLDKSGIEMIMPIINVLQTYFKKIIVITHSNDIKQYFDETITVYREKYTSVVDVI